ncbi:MAG: hypothetical protein U0X91_20750 [Spirosomataceae bacterium]
MSNLTRIIGYGSFGNISSTFAQLLMSLSLKIKQQEATVTMLKTLLKAKRTTEREVQAAEAELSRLRSVNSSTPSLSNPTPSFPKGGIATADRRPDYQRAIEATLADDPYSLKQKNLTGEADRLRQEQARLSNLLHKVPQNQACPELTEKILALQDEIEGIWDEKKFLERNQDSTIAAPALITPAAAAPTTVESITHKAVLSVDIQKLREKRAKLKKKLADLSASASKRAAWEVELAQTDAAISEKTLAKEALN